MCSLLAFADHAHLVSSYQILKDGEALDFRCLSAGLESIGRGGPSDTLPYLAQALGQVYQPLPYCAGRRPKYAAVLSPEKCKEPLLPPNLGMQTDPPQ